MKGTNNVQWRSSHFETGSFLLLDFLSDLPRGLIPVLFVLFYIPFTLRS